MLAGIFSTIPLIGAWNSNNIGGSLKRGVGIAMQVGFGNFGGAVAGFVYLAQDQPRCAAYPTNSRCAELIYTQVYQRTCNTHRPHLNVPFPVNSHDLLLSPRELPS